MTDAEHRQTHEHIQAQLDELHRTLFATSAQVARMQADMTTAELRMTHGIAKAAVREVFQVFDVDIDDYNSRLEFLNHWRFAALMFRAAKYGGIALITTFTGLALTAAWLSAKEFFYK